MSAPLTAPRVDHELTERFAALICADPGLLDVEFNAIVAAEWPTPPPGEDCFAVVLRRRPDAGDVPETRSAGLGIWAACVRVVPAWRRSRSPPVGDQRPDPMHPISRKAGEAVAPAR